MKPRRVVEEVLVPATIFAAPPATVTQRTCLEHFGIAPSDYLRLAGVAFPVKAEGKLRVARYADVERYLTEGATLRPKRVRAAAPPAEPKKRGPLDAVEAMDSSVVLRRLGFRPRR
jgi:hypothetical protein